MRSYDLYLTWRDGSHAPPLEGFPNLVEVRLPMALVTRRRIERLARIGITSLVVEMGDGGDRAAAPAGPTG